MAKLNDKEIKALQINSMAQSKGWKKLEEDMRNALENKKKKLLRLDEVADIKRTQGEAKIIQELLDKVEYYQRKAQKVDR